jgi:hypothetical protein
MRSLLRRTLPALVLPLALWGLSPTPAEAAPSAPTTTVTTTAADEAKAPSPGQVRRALRAAPDALVPDTVGVTTVDSEQVVSGEVTVPRDPADPVLLGPEGEGLSIGLPVVGGELSVVRDGVSIFQNDADATSVAVNPLTDGGTQFLVAIGAADSPETYAFPVEVPDGAGLELTEDGGAQVVAGDNGTLATIPAPWAKDANGADVPTHFEITDGALVQVVDHVDSGATYPILADPSVFSCDAWTYTCVKFTRAETQAINNFASPGVVGAAVWAGALCSKIPVGALVIACQAVVTVYAYLLDRSFSNAASEGRCVEMHFPRINSVLWWKTESC